MIRLATKKDLPVLLGLAFEFHKAAHFKRHATFEDSISYWEKWILGCIEDDSRLCLIGHVKNQPAGFFTSFTFHAFWNENVKAAYETAFWVSPNYRGAGLGSAILEAFCLWGKEQGVTIVAAGSTVYMSPKKMGNLLAKHGFQLEERIYSKKVT